MSALPVSSIYHELPESTPSGMPPSRGGRGINQNHIPGDSKFIANIIICSYIVLILLTCGCVCCGCRKERLFGSDFGAQNLVNWRSDVEGRNKRANHDHPQHPTFQPGCSC